MYKMTYGMSEKGKICIKRLKISLHNFPYFKQTIHIILPYTLVIGGDKIVI